MRRVVLPPILVVAGLTLLLTASALAPSKADDLAQRVTVDVAPVWVFATNADANAPPPPGSVGIGYKPDQKIADSVRIDYGIDFKLTDKLHLSFNHGNVGYSLGRILTLAPNTAFVSGAIYDYTDTIALGYSAGHGLGLHVSYFNHQRSDVSGLCLNQKKCPDATGVDVPNPLSIDERGYTVGATYDFGPATRIGPLFSAAFDVKYVPRPSTPSSPNVALGGLPSYVGSQTLYPYSLTMKLPFTTSTTFVPFVNYTNLPVLYRDSAVPEAYRGIVFGFSKVLSPNVTVSYTNLNLQSCRCIARVPPPDNLRLAFGILKLDFHTKL